MIYERMGRYSTYVSCSEHPFTLCAELYGYPWKSDAVVCGGLFSHFWADDAVLGEGNSFLVLKRRLISCRSEYDIDRAPSV